MTRKPKQFPWVCDFGDHSSTRVLSILRRLADDDWGRAMSSGLVISPGGSNRARLLMQMPPSGKASRETNRFIDTLLGICDDLGIRIDRKRMQAFSRMDVSVTLDPLQGAIVLATRAQTALTAVDAAERAIDEDFLVVLEAEDAETLAKSKASILRYGRDHRDVAIGRPDGGGVLTGVVLKDHAEDYGNLRVQLGRSDVTIKTDVLRSSPLRGRRLWSNLPDDREIEDSALRDLDAILAAAATGDAMLGEGDPVFIEDGEAGGLFFFSRSVTEAAPTLNEPIRAEPVQPFELRSLTSVHGEKELSDLKAKIEALSPKLGYEVQLVKMRREIGPGTDIERLREEIDELELLVDQASVYEAPQMRMLRFSDAQLGQMVTALRTLPFPALNDGKLKYASGHSAGRADPVHYLLYDPTEKSLHVAEGLWRGEASDNHPIGYWLEPFVAKAHAGRPSKTSVFVPVGKFLQPSLAHFGGAIEETLRAVLGDLFHSVQEVVERPETRPAFIFSPWDGDEFTMEVEVVDMASFGPLHLQLPWINDYLQVRDARSLDREALSNIADQLYAADYIENERQVLSSIVEDAEAAWSTATSRLREDAVAVVRSLDSEMRAGTERLAAVRAHMNTIQTEMDELERVLAVAEGALDAHLDIGGALEEKDLSMRRAREQFVDRVANEMFRGETELERLDERIQRLREHLSKLMRGREW